MSIRIIVLALFLLTQGFAADSPTASELTALERFAMQPTAGIAWSSDLQRIDSAEAHAAVMAVVVEDTAQTPSQMRGIRIDLSTAGVEDRVYVPEQFVDQLLKSLQDVSADAPGFMATNRGGNVCFGSCEFLTALREGAHFFSVSQCSSVDGAALSVSTGREQFRFAGLDPSPFASAIKQARAALSER